MERLEAGTTVALDTGNWRSLFYVKEIWTSEHFESAGREEITVTLKLRLSPFIVNSHVKVEITPSLE